MIGYIIIAGIVFLAIIAYIVIYNGLVSTKNKVEQAWSGIDVQLKRRANLIPNLIETVKAYTKHEKEVLENLTKARTQIMQAGTNVKKASQADNELEGALKSIFAVAENYPELKANQNYLKLQQELSNTEDLIAAARRIYNSNTAIYNTKIQSFPNSIIAGIHKFKNSDYFETGEKAVPGINL
ncbi:MAG: LemA family protein [Nanoarchaeota archaeon]